MVLTLVVTIGALLAAWAIIATIQTDRLMDEPEPEDVRRGFEVVTKPDEKKE